MIVSEETRKKYQVVIGLEIHAQLLTKSKIFASDKTDYGASPNTQVSFITLGHPGTLPKLNKKAVEYAIRMGLACKSDIAREMVFDRKNYFYPDLPKGYQITQDRTPICKGGQVIINDGDTEKIIELNRIHLEEDAGKSMHMEGERFSMVDFNRAGVPLIEIVTEPMLQSAAEAQALLAEIRKMVRFLGICDGNMEEGSLRCDANISIMPAGTNEFGNKVEIKNLNSLRFLKLAVEGEIDRQIHLAEAGEEIISETRGYDEASGTTRGQRVKEALNDYRYFPDPDICPVHISEEWIEAIRATMPAMPRELFTAFTTRYQLPAYDAKVLTDDKELAAYFQQVCAHTTHYKAVSNWLMGPVKSHLNEYNLLISELSVSPQRLAELIELVEAHVISFSAAAQKLLPVLAANATVSVSSLAQSLDLIHERNDDKIGELIDSMLDDFPDKVMAYRKGQKGLLGMFMGELMKRSEGKADPRVANDLLKKKLEI